MTHLRDILSLLGFEVRSAGSIAEAVALFQREPRQAIVLDMHLGDENGLEALHEFKRTNPKAIALLITGFPALRAQLESGLEMKAYASFMKPFAPEDLIYALRRAIDEMQT